MSDLSRDEKIKKMMDDLKNNSNGEYLYKALIQLRNEGNTEFESLISLYSEQQAIAIETKAIDVRENISSIRKLIDEIDDIVVSFETKGDQLQSKVDELQKEMNLYKTNLTNLNKLIMEYKNLTGIGDYQVKDIYLSATEEKIKRIYTDIAKLVIQLNKELINVNSADIANKERLEKALEKLELSISYLPEFLEYKSKFDNIKNEVDASLGSGVLSKDELKKQFKDQIKEIFIKAKPVIETRFKSLDYSIYEEYEKLKDDIFDVAEPFSLLTDEEKNLIIDEVEKEVDFLSGVSLDLFDELIYGERRNPSEINGLISILHNKVEPLMQADFGNINNIRLVYSRILKNVNTVKKFVADLQNNNILKSNGAKIILDENNLVLTIEIPNASIKYSKAFRKEIVDNYVAYKANAILEEYAREVRPIFERKYKDYFEHICQLQKQNIVYFDELIKNKGQEFKQKLIDMNIPDDKATLLINKRADQISEECRDKYAKEDLDAANFIETNVIDQYLVIERSINELNAFVYASPEFTQRYDAVRKSINDFIAFMSKDENKKYGIRVAFDEDQENFYIEYNISFSNGIGPHSGSTSILILSSENFLAKKNSKSAPGGSPIVPPSGGSSSKGGSMVPPISISDEQNDQQLYMEKIDNINNMIYTLNQMNDYAIVLDDSLPLLDDFIQNTIEREKEARKLDLEIISAKVELSKDRLDYSKKYKKLLFSVPEIKNKKIDEIAFKVPYKSFIEKHDTLIVKAEMEITKLTEKRKNDPSSAQLCNNRIKLLLEFIECQNSVVGRCLITEREKSNIDILQVLEERRDFKNQLRGKLAKDYKPYGLGSDDIPDDVQDDNLNDGVTISRSALSFNPKNVSKINRNRSGIMSDIDVLIVSIIRNGIKIKYSKDLAEKLHDVKARLSLVNKDNSRSRRQADVEIAPNGEEFATSEITFKGKDGINPDDYKIEIRDDDGVLYEYDLANLPEEEKGKAL